MNPLVTVVVTTYNQAAFIEQTLESVLAQTYEPREIIVVDDGSSDDTPTRIAPYANRIVSVRQENQGVAGSRNTGIRKARGEYIAFLDGDDLWDPEKLSVQVKVAREYPNSGLIVVDGQEFDEGGVISPSLFFAPCCREIAEGSVASRRFYREFLDITLVATTSQVMIPTRVFQEVGLSDPGFERASDYDLYLRIAARFDVTLVKKRLTYWRYSSTSVSGIKSRRSFRYLPEDIAILKKQLAGCRGEERISLRGIIKARLATGAEKLYYYGLEQDRNFATRILLRLLAGNFCCPFLILYLAGLWCSESVRSRFGKLVRTMLLHT